MIEGIPVLDWTAEGALFVVVLLVVRGLLVPRRTYDDMREFLIADRDQWRAAHAVSESAREIQDQQVRELLEQSHTTLAIAQGLVQAAERNTR